MNKLNAVLALVFVFGSLNSFAEVTKTKIVARDHVLQQLAIFNDPKADRIVAGQAALDLGEQVETLGAVEWQKLVLNDFASVLRKKTEKSLRRPYAVRSLRKLKTPSATAVLKEVIQDENDFVKAEAMQALALHGHLDTIETCLTTLKESKSNELVKGAMKALTIFYISHPEDEQLKEARNDILKVASHFFNYFPMESYDLRLAASEGRHPRPNERPTNPGNPSDR